MNNLLKHLIYDYGEMLAVVGLGLAIGLFVGWLITDFAGLM